MQPAELDAVLSPLTTRQLVQELGPELSLHNSFCLSNLNTHRIVAPSFNHNTPRPVKQFCEKRQKERQRGTPPSACMLYIIQDWCGEQAPLSNQPDSVYVSPHTYLYLCCHLGRRISTNLKTGQAKQMSDCTPACAESILSAGMSSSGKACSGLANRGCFPRKSQSIGGCWIDCNLKGKHPLLSSPVQAFPEDDAYQQTKYFLHTQECRGVHALICLAWPVLRFVETRLFCDTYTLI